MLPRSASVRFWNRPISPSSRWCASCIFGLPLGSHSSSLNRDGRSEGLPRGGAAMSAAHLSFDGLLAAGPSPAEFTEDQKPDGPSPPRLEDLVHIDRLVRGQPDRTSARRHGRIVRSTLRPTRRAMTSLMGPRLIAEFLVTAPPRRLSVPGRQRLRQDLRTQMLSRPAATASDCRTLPSLTHPLPPHQTLRTDATETIAEQPHPDPGESVSAQPAAIPRRIQTIRRLHTCQRLDGNGPVRRSLEKKQYLHHQVIHVAKVTPTHSIRPYHPWGVKTRRPAWVDGPA